MDNLLRGCPIYRGGLRRENDLDVRLMRELASPGSFRWDVRESYSNIARKLGIDEETVRRRLKRAQLAGVLEGFHLIPNPHLFHMESSAVELEVDNEAKKQEIVSQIRLLEGVVLVVDFHGNRLRVVIYYEDDRTLARRIILINSICASRGEIHWTENFPPCDVKMKETDWLILRSLRREAKKRLEDVADEVHISTRTVKRRSEGMIEGNAFYLMPITSYEKSAVVICSFTVDCPDPQQKKAADMSIKSLLQRIIFSNTSAKRYSVFSVLCNNLGEAESIQEEIAGVKGIGSVKMGIVRKVYFVSDWLDDQIGRKAAQANTAS